MSFSSTALVSQSLRKTGLVSAVALALTVSFSGCGGGNDVPPLAQVYGTVTRAGTPVPNAVVEFFPQKGRRSTGTTNSSGKFELEYSHGEPGAMLGTHEVTFSLPPQLTPKQIAQSEKLQGSEKEEFIRRAGDPKPIQHKEMVEVKAGNNDFKFDLTDKK